ncbi:outer envelope pore protein 21B, chloroplastic [Argentina anserina]|uniref:outer envelope pore protein 21B, chloroplastic n=1 Tax=Argentina anserina TaxID=57926 RepID=UPI00217681D1|nr:outer envelope pore protein 21B, chloroplastic [Potentilla anserina]
METSLRYGGDSRALRIHAKQKLPLDSFTRLQVHGELDTKVGAPTHFTALVRRFYPDFSTSIGAGLQYDKRNKLRYTIRGKKAFPVTKNESVNFVVKGSYDLDKDFREKGSKGAAEFSWSIIDFQKDQDVRFKVGYDLIEKVPYAQIRENNWTLNADFNGRWNVRFDL